MEEERRSLPQPTLVTMLTGGLSALLGLAVLVGWYAHNTTLVQVVPTWVSMHYNAALGFLLCGIGLLALASGRPWLGAACGLGVLMLGLLPLIEDIFDVHLGITQLPIQPSIEFTPPLPRLPPNATLSFVLAGTAVLVMSQSGALEYTSLIPGLLGTMVCALGLIAFLGDMFAAKLAQDWGRHSCMAIMPRPDLSSSAAALWCARGNTGGCKTPPPHTGFQPVLALAACW